MKNSFLFVLVVASLCCITSCEASGIQQRPSVGVSFSLYTAGYLSGEKFNGPGVGPKWREGLKKLLSLHPAVVRLPMQWDQVEQTKGRYDWREIDEAIALCKQYGVPVILCIGVKTPRPPEVYIPNIYQSLLPPPKPDRLIESAYLGEAIRKPLLAYVAAALRRYGNDARIARLQIENEPLEHTGPKLQAIRLSLLNEEIALAHKLSRKPLATTMGTGVTDTPGADQVYQFFLKKTAKQFRADEQAKILKLNVDYVGINLYRKGHSGAGAFEMKPEHWTEIKQTVAAIRRAGKKPFIAELQGEPWNEGGKMNHRDPNGNPTLTPEQYRQFFIQATAQLDVKEVLLWGMEFQLTCAQQKNLAWLSVTHDLTGRR